MEPFEEKSEGCNNRGGDCMAVDDKDIVAHTGVEGYFGNYVHAGVPKLERYHGEVGFRAFEKAFAATKTLHRHYVFVF